MDAYLGVSACGGDHKMRAGIRRLAALALALIIAAVPTLAFANHTANCSEYGYVYRHNGYLSTDWSNHRYGVMATIGNRSLELCTNPRVGEGSASAAWVAIQGPRTSGNNLVQVGMARCRAPSSTCDAQIMRDFYAYGRDNIAPGCAGWSPLAPTAHWFTVWSGGNPYSVTQEADGDFWVTTANANLYLSTNLSAGPISP